MDTTEYGITGFFVLPRMTWRNKRDKLLYQDLLEGANYKDAAQLKRGQLFTSYLSLAEQTGWSVKQVRGSMDHLKKQGLIQVESFKNKKDGIKVTIVHYEPFQSLDFYAQKGEYKGNNEDECKGEYSNAENPYVPRVEEGLEGGKGELKGDNKDDKKGNPLTTDITTDKQQKERDKDLPEQLSKTEDVEAFVDSHMLINPLPSLPRKLFVEYFNTVRLTRRTGRIATSKAQKIWDKLLTYQHNKKLATTEEGRSAVILYALTVHIMQHDDKPEEYTYGIIRRTTEHEARQKMLKLMNRSGGDSHEIHAGNLSPERSDYHRKRRTF